MVRKVQDRREQMAKYILSKGEVTIAELEKMFEDVSEMTIRRDLEHLEGRGDIIRVKGGAKSIALLSGAFKEDSYSKRAMLNIQAKMQIADKAAALITDEHSIYLDPGSTVMMLTKKLPDKSLFVVTSGPNVALEVMKNQLCTINLVGGELNRENICVSGPSSIAFVDNINIELAFIVASGFGKKAGFTCGNHNECELKKKVIKKATRTVLLMDSSKVNRNMPFTFAYPEDIDIVVTDDQIDEEIAKFITSKGAKLL